MARIAERGDSDPPTEVLLASGESPVDAAAAAQLSATGVPLLLTTRDSIPEATIQALNEQGFDTVTIVGGEAAVSAEVERELMDLGLTVDRLDGATRFATSTMLASRAAPDASAIWVVPANDWRSSLTAGVAAEAWIRCTIRPVAVVYGPSESLDDAPALEAFLAGHPAPIGHIKLMANRDAISPLVFEQVNEYLD